MEFEKSLYQPRKSVSFWRNGVLVPQIPHHFVNRHVIRQDLNEQQSH